MCSYKWSAKVSVIMVFVVGVGALMGAIRVVVVQVIIQ